MLVAFKLLIVVVVVWFIRSTIVAGWTELEKSPPHVDFRWLAAAGGLYLLGTLFSGIFWYFALRRLGQNVSFWTALRAFYIGHLGKYVPGKAMVVILRAGLIRGPGVDASLAVVSIFFETLTMMSVGALLAAAIVAVWFRGQPLLLCTSLVVLAVAGLPTFPPLFRRLVRLIGLGRLKPGILERLDRLGYGIVLLGWLLNVIGWAILGLSYWAVLRSLGGDSGDPLAQLHLYTAGVSLAVVAGFVSFVPAGAVVRDVVLIEFMAQALRVSDAVALAAAVLLRLAWLAAELVAAGLLSVSRLRTRQIRTGAAEVSPPDRGDPTPEP
jgi:glycosyltransferase 2 family protein